MPVQRKTDPLPVGVYWYAVADVKQPGFDAWVRLSPGVTVLRSVQEKPGTLAHKLGDPDIFYTWILFAVTEPSVWPEGLGFPNVAEKGEETEREDTIQEPPPERDFLDELPTSADIAKGFSTLAWVLGLGLVAAVVLSGRK